MRINNVLIGILVLIAGCASHLVEINDETLPTAKGDGNEECGASVGSKDFVHLQTFQDKFVATIAMDGVSAPWSGSRDDSGVKPSEIGQEFQAKAKGVFSNVVRISESGQRRVEFVFNPLPDGNYILNAALGRGESARGTGSRWLVLPMGGNFVVEMPEKNHPNGHSRTVAFQVKENGRKVCSVVASVKENGGKLASESASGGDWTLGEQLRGKRD